MKRTFFLLVLVAIFFCACNEKNPAGSISCDPAIKAASALGDEFVVNVKSTTPWSASVNQSWVTVSPDTGQGDAFVTVKTTADKTGRAQVIFSNGESTTTLTIERGSTAYPAIASDKGMLPGEFSVGSKTKVRFSQGNLQYVGTWQFAASQLEYFGKLQSNNHRDLFGWGTGDAPNEYRAEDKYYSTFTDWGTNAITNGGNTANTWRTLTQYEWMYLFDQRKTLFGFGCMNGINGMILLPDKWTTPAGLSFVSATANGMKRAYDTSYGFFYYDNNRNHFADNTYTVEQWKVMESAGAVFLPAAGSRYDTDVKDFGSEGNYWSASREPAYAYLIHFVSDYLYYYKYHTAPSCGRSVRLVKDVE